MVVLLQCMCGGTPLRQADNLENRALKTFCDPLATLGAEIDLN
jgi:hypothetical protein